MKLNSNAGEVEIIPIQTGTVAVKQRFRDARFKNPILGKLDFLMNKDFTEQMPIWVWVVKHPEGIFVIDTGENAHVNDKTYFDKAGAFTKWVNKSQFNFEVTHNEEIGVQLKRLGIDNQQIKQVIITHLHIDHFDGLHDFEGVEVLVHDIEWKNPNFAIPSLYPEWFKPSLISTNKSVEAGFNAYPLTESNDLFVIHTPGHTTGHCSILLKGIDFSVIFAGDAVYYQQQLRDETFSGGIQNFKVAGKTYHTLREYMSKQPTIFLPSHDKNAERRLENLEMYH